MQTGIKSLLTFKFYAENIYASLKREHLSIHLQWHADTKEDSLLGGSVIKLFVKI